MHQLLPQSWTVPGPSGRSLLELGVQEITQLPIDQRHMLMEAYRHAIASTFLAGAGIAVLAFVLVLFLPEKPLRTRKMPENPEPVA